MLGDVLGCPACGEDGAIADADGLFHDEQDLICGCNGWVSVDDAGPYIYIVEEPFYDPPTIR